MSHIGAFYLTDYEVLAEIEMAPCQRALFTGWLAAAFRKPARVLRERGDGIFILLTPHNKY